MAGDKPTPPNWHVKPNVKVPAKNFNNQGRVNLKVEDFDRLLEQKGVRVKIFRSMLCPRVASIDGQEHDVECPLCHGAQFIDRACNETIAFFQGQDGEKDQQAEGLVDGDTIKATFARGIELQYFTRVDLIDFEDAFYQRVKRQRGPVDYLRYQATCVNILIASDGKEYHVGNDFELDPSGSIRWKTGRSPEAGTIYSVHYQMKKSFRAIKARHIERYTQVQKSNEVEMVKLFEQWVLQKDYLVERKDFLGNPLPENKINDEETE